MEYVYTNTRDKSFRSVITKLTSFWQGHGCSILDPYDLEMGAGTFHPAVVRQSFCKSAARIAFVQPCRRPQDSRGGENPNRLFRHHQFEVLLSPPPKDIQVLIEKSLYVCGINPAVHNIDFISDDWKSPIIGAYGKGYEIRCNGMEVCQFTYFQQMGGKNVSIVPVELAYGLERLLLIVQRKDHIFDLVWDVVDDKEITYGEVYAAFEKESNDFPYAHEDLIQMFDLYQKICSTSLSEAFTPKYENFLKLCHTFNLIENSGIGKNERVKFLKTVRECAKNCLRSLYE